MSITISGPAAAFLAVVQSAGSYQLALKQDANTLAPGAYSFDLTEYQPGYTPPTRVTSGLSITVEGSADEPIHVTSLTAIPERTFILKRVNALDSPSLSSLYAALAVQPFNPQDTSPWWIDMSQMLADNEPLTAIVRLSPTPAAAALGISIDQGARRPSISTGQKLVQFRLRCNAVDLTAFQATGVLVGIDIAFTTLSEDGQVDEFHKTIGLTAQIT